MKKRKTAEAPNGDAEGEDDTAEAAKGDVDDEDDDDVVETEKPAAKEAVKATEAPVEKEAEDKAVAANGEEA